MQYIHATSIIIIWTLVVLTIILIVIIPPFIQLQKEEDKEVEEDEDDEEDLEDEVEEEEEEEEIPVNLPQYPLLLFYLPITLRNGDDTDFMTICHHFLQHYTQHFLDNNELILHAFIRDRMSHLKVFDIKSQLKIFVQYVHTFQLESLTRADLNTKIQKHQVTDEKKIIDLIIKTFNVHFQKMLVGPPTSKIDKVFHLIDWICDIAIFDCFMYRIRNKTTNKITRIYWNQISQIGANYRGNDQKKKLTIYDMMVVFLHTKYLPNDYQIDYVGDDKLLQFWLIRVTYGQIENILQHKFTIKVIMKLLKRYSMDMVPIDVDIQSLHDEILHNIQQITDRDSGLEIYRYTYGGL